MISKILSVLYIICNRYLVEKLRNISIYVVLRLRGMHGGKGLVAHKMISVRDWACNLYLGDNVTLHQGVRLILSRKTRLELGDKVWISAYTTIISSNETQVIIGKDTMIGPNTVIVSADHDIHDKLSLRESGAKSGDIYIGENCWIGANCVITKNVRIGMGAIIGAGSVVTKDIPSMTIATGIPAKVIKKRYIK